MAGCSSTRESGARAQLPRLEYARTELREYGTSDSRYQRAMDIITLVNDTPLTFEYTGDDKDWPAYSCQTRDGDRWQDVQRTVCVFSWRPQTLAPGETVELVVHGHYPGEKRIGLRVVDKSTGQETCVWSAGYDSRVEYSEVAGLMHRLSRRLPESPYSRTGGAFTPLVPFPGLPLMCDGYVLTLWHEEQADRLWILEQGGIGGRARWFGPIEAEEDALIRTVLPKLGNVFAVASLPKAR